jgi:hypothetical protein
MANKYTIKLSEEQYRLLDERARQQGYTNAAAYVMALAEDTGDEDAPTKEEVLAGLREGWQDAMTGNTHPASVLWDDEFWDEDDDE